MNFPSVHFRHTVLLRKGGNKNSWILSLNYQEQKDTVKNVLLSNKYSFFNLQEKTFFLTLIIFMLYLLFFFLINRNRDCSTHEYYYCC